MYEISKFLNPVSQEMSKKMDTELFTNVTRDIQKHTWNYHWHFYGIWNCVCGCLTIKFYVYLGSAYIISLNTNSNLD